MIHEINLGGIMFIGILYWFIISYITILILTKMYKHAGNKAIQTIYEKYTDTLQQLNERIIYLENKLKENNINVT